MPTAFPVATVLFGHSGLRFGITSRSEHSSLPRVAGLVGDVWDIGLYRTKGDSNVPGMAYGRPGPTNLCYTETTPVRGLAAVCRTAGVVRYLSVHATFASSAVFRCNHPQRRAAEKHGPRLLHSALVVRTFGRLFDRL